MIVIRKTEERIVKNEAQIYNDRFGYYIDQYHKSIKYASKGVI